MTLIDEIQSFGEQPQEIIKSLKGRFATIRTRFAFYSRCLIIRHGLDTMSVRYTTSQWNLQSPEVFGKQHSEVDEIKLKDIVELQVLSYE